MFARPKLCPPTEDTVMITKRQLLAGALHLRRLSYDTQFLAGQSGAASRPGFFAARTSRKPACIRASDRDELRNDVRLRGQQIRPVQPRSTRSTRLQRLHLQGHGGRHSEQRHALFVVVAGSARRADRDLGAGDRKEALLFGSALRQQSYNFGYIGSRATGNEAGDYMVVGPDWNGETPAGIKKVFRSEHTIHRAIFRTQLFDPADIDNVKKVQAGYKVEPLSAYLKQPTPPEPRPSWSRFKMELLKTTFPSISTSCWNSSPGAEETDIRAKLASIGMGPDKTFAFEDLSLEQKPEWPWAEAGPRQSRKGRRQRPARSSMAGTSAGPWRRALLQRRLAASRRRRPGRHLRQQRG